ncbi:hypothetical protein QVD17_38041 [Tagetes erecta]|uniref:DUF4216 domain-containing protein n=1 Tax=Tagetes erecta TaxID=13708 RepID=A0AAD8JZG8_TARER|nr:hypothetical protein QVD17_38041 [Tagetes erecta]
MEVDAAATDDDDNGYRRMVLDSMLPSDYNSTQQVNLESNNLEVHAPNHEAKGFYDMLEATDELLWEGEKATDFKKLEAATNFLNWKSMFNVSTACYNHNISMFRWMYLYERKLGRLKRTIRNKARVEGSIVESYLVDELSNYCSLYLDATLNTRLNREPRNFAPDILCSSSTDNRLSIFKHPSRRLSRGKPILPTDKDRLKAHTYTLLNCQELHDFVIIYDEEQRALFPDCEKAILDEKKDEGFARWLQIYVLGNPVNSHIRDVAQGPLNYVQSHKGYFVNGYKFHTQTAYHGRVTENSGVCVKGASYDEHESDYYGLLDEILELEYHSSLGACIVVLFKCTWFHPVDGVRVDSKTNMVDVNPKVIGCTKDPFVLASQAQQVYYTPYPSKDKGLKDWWAVIKTSPRGVYELAEDDNIVGDDDEEDTEHFFQENERLTCASTEDLSYVTHVETNVIEEVDDVNDGDQEEEEAAFECIDSDEDVDEFEDEDTD